MSTLLEIPLHVYLALSGAKCVNRVTEHGDDMHDNEPRLAKTS